MPEEATAEAEEKESEGSQEETRETPSSLLGFGDEPKAESKDGEEGSAKEGEEKSDKLAGKYDSVDELEKGYLNAQKLISERHAPEKYEYSKELKDFVGDKEDEMLDGFVKVAKKVDLSQKAFDEIVKWRMGDIETMKQKRAETIEAEYKKMGSNAQNRVSAVRAFLATNLTKAQYNSLGAKINSAEDLTAIEKLIEKATSAVPSGAAVKTSPSTVKDLEQQLDSLINKQSKTEGTPDPALDEKIRALSKKISKAKGI